MMDELSQLAEAAGRIAAIAPEVAFGSIIVAARKSIENMRSFVEEPDEGINEMWREYAAAINDPPLSDEQKKVAFLTATASPPAPKNQE